MAVAELSQKKMTLGQKVVGLRKLRGYSQQDFAPLIGIHVNYLSRIENDKMKPGEKTLEKMAELLGVSIDDMYQDIETQPSLIEPQLLRAFQLAQTLEDEDKKLVIRIVNALMTKKRVEQAIQDED